MGIEPKHRVRKSGRLLQEVVEIFLRKIFLKIDLLRFKNLCRNLEQNQFDYIVSDRYFYDNLVNIAYLSKTKFFLKEKIKTPDFSFYLEILPENIMQRDRIPEQGIKYLENKKALYDLLSKEFSLIKLNGEKNKEDIFNEIKTKIVL